MSKEKVTDESIKRKNAISKELSLLYEIKKYLEFNPTQEFCESEVTRLTNIVELANDSWQNEAKRRTQINPKFETLPQKSITKFKTAFLKDMNLTLIKSQVKNLKYILNERRTNSN